MQTVARQKRSILTPAVRREIRREVYQAIEDLRADPDDGLELRSEFVRELKKRINSKEKGITFAEAKQRLGLK